MLIYSLVRYIVTAYFCFVQDIVEIDCDFLYLHGVTYLLEYNAWTI